MNYKLPVAIVLLCLHVVLGSEEVTQQDAETNDDGSLNRVRRGGLSMLRLGRGLQMLRLGKRALPMLRLGRSTNPAVSDEELEYLISLMRNDRQVPLPRYGKDMSLEYMIMNALKNAEMNSEMYGDSDDAASFGYGYDLDAAPARHIRPAPRPGMRYRRSTQDVSADANGLPNLKAESDDLGEPNYHWGKRGMRMLRLGRNHPMASDELQSVDDDEQFTEADKRALRLLRLGKRPFKMLRMGRNDAQKEDMDKRALRLLRLGRSETAES